MKIAVTGAYGGLGSVFVALLKGCARDVTPFPKRQDLDLADERKLLSWLSGQRPDVVVHFAGPKTARSVAELYGQTLSNGRNLVEAFLAVNPVGRLIVVSSAAVYGSQAHVPIPVGAPLRGRTVYACAKIALEQLVSRYSAEFGLDVRIARVFNPTDAPGDTKSVVPALRERLEKSKAGETFEVINGNAVRDFVTSIDVAKGLLLVCDRSDAPPVSNLSTGTGTSILEVAKAIASQLDLRIEFETSPGDPDDVEVSIGDSSGMRTLGWEPTLPFG